MKTNIKKFNQYIAVAADNVQRLRGCDVDRVLDWASPKKRASLGEYIISNRPDLAKYVQDAQND